MIETEYKKGIDVSRYQSVDIDWVKLRNLGYTFAFIKATEGSKYPKSYIDICVQHADNAINAGFNVGYYHYGLPDGVMANDAQEEAEYFCETVKTKFPYPALEMVLDFEYPNINFDKDEALNWISNFFWKLDQEGFKKPMLYSYKYYIDDHLPADAGDILNSFPYWHAQYVPSIDSPAFKLPKAIRTCAQWQYTSQNPIPLLNGSVIKVDTNLRYI